MLTNNKKSTFIKSIAMIMAVLMVLAVALTGCGNKAAEEAAQKAENAQNTADEAKTAAEKIAADLVNYLKVENAITAEAINKMITDALGTYPTTEDLAAYVNGEMTKVNDKIAALVTADQLAAKITEALAGYATSAGLTDAIASAKTELQNKIAEEIAKVNKNTEVKTLQDKVAALESNKTTVANELTALKNKDTELQTKISAAESALNTAKTDLQNKINTANSNITTLQDKVTAAEASLKALQAADSALAADIAAAEQALADAKAALEAADEANAKAIAAVQTQVTTAEASLKALQAVDEELAADIEGLQAQLNQMVTDIDTAVAALKKADADLLAAITAVAEDYLVGADKAELQALIEANTAAIKELRGTIEQMGADLDKVAADYATQTALDAALEELRAADAAMAADIKQLQEVVMAILEAFGVETETVAEKTLAELLKEFSPAAITAAIADKMSLTNWNDATDIVLETIESLQNLFTKIYGENGWRDWYINYDGDRVWYANEFDDGIYTQTDKNAINAAIAKINKDIVIFTEDGELADEEVVTKQLEYMILRAPTVEAINELKSYINEALAVKTFDEKLDDLTAELKALGHTHTYGTGANAKDYQITTVDDLADFYAFNDNLDELIVSYCYDLVAKNDSKVTDYDQFLHTNYETTLGAMPVYGVYYATYKDTTKTSYYYYYNADVTTQPANAGGWTYTHQFYTINTWVLDNIHGGYAPKYSHEGKWTGTMYEYVDIYQVTAFDDIFNWGDYYVAGRSFEDLHGEEFLVTTVKDYSKAGLADTYLAVYNQLYNALWAIRDANMTMYWFINTQLMNGKIVVNGAEVALKDAKSLGLITDVADYYVEALEVEMCEPMTTEDYNSSKYFLMNAKYEQRDVEEAMNYAFNLNTCEGIEPEYHSDELKGRIDEYDLYYDLMNEAWNLLFDRYRDDAKALVEKIIEDYKSILYATTVPANGAYSNLDAVINSTYIEGAWMDMAKENLVSADAAYAPIFVKAFLNGAKNFTWQSAGTAVANTGITITKNFDNALVTFYKNNGTAYTGTKAADEAKIYSNPLATILANVPKLELLLTANTYDIVNYLGTLEGEDVPAEERTTNIKDFFNEYIEEAIDNLDETYARYLVEDFKKAVYNDLYVEAAKFTTLYTVNDQATALQEALEHFITGYSHKAGTAGAAGAANKLFKKETLLNNATVMTELAKIVVAPELKVPTDGETEVAYTATGYMTEILNKAFRNTQNVTIVVNGEESTVTVNSAYIGVMENAAVKNNFENYLATAITNVEYVATQYGSAAGMTPELRAKVELARQESRGNISVIQWQTAYNADTWAILTYKTYYTQLLLQISSLDAKTAEHYEYLTNTSVADALLEILSYKYKDVAPGNGWVNGYAVIKPKQVITSWNQYYCYGIAAQRMDRAANTNTKYWTATTPSVQAYLYND